MEVTLYQGFQRAYPSLASEGTPGYVESIRTSRISSWLNGVSDYFSARTHVSGSLLSHEISDVASQITVSGPAAEILLANDALSASGSSVQPDVPAAGLPADGEARETRKALLERRRRECEADEVAVAMAPVYKIPTSYMFYPEQYKRFRAMFPRVTPDPGMSFTHHDHPVAHTATLVGIRHIQQTLTPGSVYLDIYGNPNGNESYNRFQASRVRKRPNLPAPARIETMVFPNTAADMVRKHTKWGSEKDASGNARYVVANHDDIPADKFNGFLSIHSLYYMTMLDVTKLMHKNKESKLTALVNYSPEQTGTLYGELKFSKANGMTTQTSPNGEVYRHPDIDHWFQTQSFKHCPEPGNDYGSYGISWTSRCIGGPLYVLEIVYCPGHLARTKPYEPPVAPTLQVQRGAYFAFVRFGGNDVQLRISNHALASELRHFMVMRDRSNPQTLADLCVKARRITSPDLVTGTRQYEVSDGELQDHITYAYLVDAPGELELLEGVKLLRGELLVPHAEALKLQGKDAQDGFWSGILHASGVVRKHPDAAIKGRVHKAPRTNQPNSGGLLAVART